MNLQPFPQSYEVLHQGSMGMPMMMGNQMPGGALSTGALQMMPVANASGVTVFGPGMPPPPPSSSSLVGPDEYVSWNRWSRAECDDWEEEAADAEREGKGKGHSFY